MNRHDTRRDPGRDLGRGSTPMPGAAERWPGGGARAAAGLAALVGLLAAGILAAVWVLQGRGYAPCELCLLERNPFYVAVPLAAVTFAAAVQRRPALARAGFVLLAILFIGSAGLAAYHAGVEWKLWAGPSGCSGAVSGPTNVDDFMAALRHVQVVRCDAPALLVLGLSLAAWNVLASLGLAILAVWGARRASRGVPPAR